MTESEFQARVIDLARWRGWRVFHWPDSRRASEPGWPDLVFLRQGRLLVAELKTHKGRVSPAQTQVLALLQSAGIETYLWRPNNWEQIQAILSNTTSPAR